MFEPAPDGFTGQDRLGIVEGSLSCSRHESLNPGEKLALVMPNRRIAGMVWVTRFPHAKGKLSYECLPWTAVLVYRLEQPDLTVTKPPSALVDSFKLLNELQLHDCGPVLSRERNWQRPRADIRVFAETASSGPEGYGDCLI